MWMNARYTVCSIYKSAPAHTNKFYAFDVKILHILYNSASFKLCSISDALQNCHQSSSKAQVFCLNIWRQRQCSLWLGNANISLMTTDTVRIPFLTAGIYSVMSVEDWVIWWENDLPIMHKTWDHDYLICCKSGCWQKFIHCQLLLLRPSRTFNCRANYLEEITFTIALIPRRAISWNGIQKTTKAWSILQ